MSFHVPEKYRLTHGPLASTKECGNNGAFLFDDRPVKFKCIASDGGGWEHVSVSYLKSDAPPTWTIMCEVKDIFWDLEDCVIQYHPPKSEYVNNHPGCLHLWRPIGIKIPRPPLMRLMRLQPMPLTFLIYFIFILNNTRREKSNAFIS